MLIEGNPQDLLYVTCLSEHKKLSDKFLAQGTTKLSVASENQTQILRTQAWHLYKWANLTHYIFSKIVYMFISIPENWTFTRHSRSHPQSLFWRHYRTAQELAVVNSGQMWAPTIIHNLCKHGLHFDRQFYRIDMQKVLSAIHNIGASEITTYILMILKRNLSNTWHDLSTKLNMC